MHVTRDIRFAVCALARLQFVSESENALAADGLPSSYSLLYAVSTYPRICPCQGLSLNGVGLDPT